MTDAGRPRGDPRAAPMRPAAATPGREPPAPSSRERAAPRVARGDERDGPHGSGTPRRAADAGGAHVAARTSRLRAVLFDFDGLLADTETIHSREWRRVLAEEGVHVSEAEYADHWIRRGRGIEDFVRDRSLRQDPLALLERKKRRWLDAIAESLEPMPGAHALLDALHGRVPLGLVTSGRGEHVRIALARLGMERRFDAFVSFETVARRKPDPEPFLFAAEALGAPPAACVVLEDAEKGVLAAVAAGMPVVAVPNVHTRDHDFTRATRVVPSLEHVGPADLEALVGEF